MIAMTIMVDIIDRVAASNPDNAVSKWQRGRGERFLARALLPIRLIAFCVAARFSYNGEVSFNPGVDDATILLNAASNGDKSAADRLIPLVYDQLRKAAQLHLARERPDHTLSATILVHEAYLRLIGPRDIPWAGRGHFYAAAAEAMRRILIDHARTRARRGGPARPLTEIGDVAALYDADADQILAVVAAVTRLESEDPEAAALVRLRFYAGLSVEQAADALNLSPRTAARLWTYARAALYRTLSDPT